MYIYYLHKHLQINVEIDFFTIDNLLTLYGFSNLG